MSTGPTRTRSLRKPAPESSRYDKSTADIPVETPRERGNVSPSRLPKPPSSTIASANLSRTTNISRPVASTNNGSNIRPSSNRAGVSRPPLTSDNKTLSLRSGARTPTEANSSLQRVPSTRHSRNSSTSALPSRPSSSSGISNTTARTQLLPPSASTLIRPPSSASTSTTTHRPAFSTLQQHFSPARSLAPKPATHTFLAPPSPSKLPAAIAASAETARLQAELLQLSLLHRSALPTYTQFRHSARTKLHARFRDVQAANEDLVELEALETDRRNIRALKAWTADGGGGAQGWGGLEEKIQILDQVLDGVWKLSEPSSGGRYTRVVKRFERWLAGVRGILEARKQETTQDSFSDMFIDELDPEWKDELQNISRKLSSWSQQLQVLRDIPSQAQASSLALVVRGVRELVAGMGDEVRAMERVERAVMAAEEEWVREAIEAGDGDDDEGSGHGDGGVAIWRML